jgi:hypothetical protein
MNQSIVRSNIDRALNEWAHHTFLNFHEVSGISEADIKISFNQGDHWDRYPFDNKGGILAHAFYPPDGRVHLDFDEDWDETILFKTLLHEFGHTLGLSHTTNTTTVNIMSSYYSEKINGLGEDDIAGIKFLYGEKPKVIQTTTMMPTTIPRKIQTTTTMPTTIPTTIPRKIQTTTTMPTTIPTTIPRKIQTTTTMPTTIPTTIPRKIQTTTMMPTTMPNIKPRIYFNVIPATQIPRITPRIQIHGIPGTQIPRIPGTQIPRIPGTQIPRIPGTQIPRIPGTQIPRIMPRIHGIPGTQIPRIMPRIHGIPGTQIPRIMPRIHGIPRIIQPIRLIQNFFFILDGKLNLTFKDNGNK